MPSLASLAFWKHIQKQLWARVAAHPAFAMRLLRLLLLGIAFALPLTLLDRHPLREDEAIYGYWALHGLGADPLFLHVWPDKPPLFLWLLGGTLRLFGATAAGARLLNIGAHILTVAVTAALARRLWNPSTALYTTLVLALSPFALRFAPTAYTDSTLVLMGMLALCMAIYKRPLACGFWLGCAVMTKQQGVLFVPLVLGAILIQQWADSRESTRKRGKIPGSKVQSPELRDELADFGLRTLDSGLFLRQFIRCLIGFLLIVLPILFWDSQRWAVAPSPWDLGVRNYAQMQIVPIHTWWPRTRQWLDLVWYFSASHLVWIGAAFLVSVAFWRHSPFRRQAAHAHRSPASGTHLPFLTLIVVWSGAFFLLHVVSSVQTWDRYLLPLVPLWGLVLGRALGLVLRPVSMAHVSMAHVLVLAVGLGLLLVPPAVRAVDAEIPVGGDHGAYDGLDEALAHLQHTISSDDADPIVLYHRALGWHYQFYLYDELQRGAVELRWFPHATYLVDNVLKTPHKRTWLLLPDWSPVADLEPRATMQRVRVVQHGRFERMRLVELVHEAPVQCRWCSCASSGDGRGYLPGTDEDVVGYRAIRPPVPGTFRQPPQCYPTTMDAPEPAPVFNPDE